MSSPAVAYGKVYVGSGDYNIYCLDALTGAQVWSYTTGNNTASSPAVADGKIFVGSNDGNLYCLNASTGAYIWSYATGASFLSCSPAVAMGNVFIGSGDYRVYAFGFAKGVGGYWVQVNKFELLAPSIGIATTFLTAVAATALCTRRFKRGKEKQ